ncbi:MAG: hypothetical protein IPJ41_11575 [Phycisphaerales bacterium]|nr:hypothetical protein [Phycisphaerales bacterium]
MLHQKADQIPSMAATPSNPTSPPPAAGLTAASSSFILQPSSLSDPDRTLLTALFDPASDLPSTAAAHKLSLLGLAHWFAQPHIQAQVELIQSLRALQHQVWADQLRREAAEALREA